MNMQRTVFEAERRAGARNPKLGIALARSRTQRKPRMAGAQRLGDV